MSKFINLYTFVFFYPILNMCGLLKYSVNSTLKRCWGEKDWKMSKLFCSREFLANNNKKMRIKKKKRPTAQNKNGKENR